MTDAEAFILTLYSDFNERDLDAFVAKLSPDVVWIEPYNRGRAVVGREAVRERVLEYALSLWDEMQMVAHKTHLLADGRVVVMGDFVATHRKTGVLYRLPFFHAWTIASGLVTLHRHSNDTITQLRTIDGKRIR